MIAPSTGEGCYLSVTPSPTYSAICYIWECLAAESSFGQTVGHAYPSLTYGRFQRGGLTFQWQLGRCLQIADLHRECRLIPSLDLNLPVRGPPALVIRQRNMYTAEASAMAESRHRARASGSAAMSQSSSIAMLKNFDESRAGFGEWFRTVERLLCRRALTFTTGAPNGGYCVAAICLLPVWTRPRRGHLIVDLRGARSQFCYGRRSTRRRCGTSQIVRHGQNQRQAANERTNRVMTKLIVAITAAPLLTPWPFVAKGCIRGALAGGVAGHYAHHHPIAGGAAGHYYYKHKAALAARQAPAWTKAPMTPVRH